MAANTTPIYLLNAFAAGPASLPVTVDTVVSDITGAGTAPEIIVTGGTNGSIVTSIVARAVTNTGPGTVLFVYYKSSTTYKNIGHIVVEPNKNPFDGCWEGTWTNPNGAYFLKAGDSICMAPYSGVTVFHAYATGGDF